MKRLISPQGAGGGGKSGGGSGAASDAPDSLQSVAFVSVLDLLCEGEIKGLVNGMESIYLDGVPVLESNGAANFTGATIGWVNGTQTQPYIPGFAAASETNSLGTQVYNAVPVTWTLDNPEFTAAIVTLEIGELSSTDTSTGDVSGTSVEMTISCQSTTGPKIQVIDAVFTGKTSSGYERSYRFPLTGVGPWTVTVARVTVDSTSDYLVNTTYFGAITGVIDQMLTYPNSALVGMQLDARQFTDIPTRTYLIEGMLIQVPSNYDADARIYTGAWDGSFQIAYSNNPAWCLYDMLTNSRYGLGLYLNAYEINTASLYEIGQYCDELVPDGFGGQEPRFVMNACLNSAKAAYDMIQDLCSVFRGMSYWGLGTVLLTQDSPQAPTAFFSRANVIGGQFSYSGSARKDRHTVAYVQYNDPTQQYAQNTEYVESPEGIIRYGVRAVQVMAIGTTSRGQAARLGLWTLLTEQLDTDQLTFQAGLEAAYLVPGQIIQIADPTRAGVRMGGRTVAGTVDSIFLDAPITFDAGQTYTLYYMDSTGTQQSVGVANTLGTTDELSFTTSMPTAPNPGFMWALSGSDVNLQLFRVINVQESSRNIFSVLAVSYNESKFNGIDFGTALYLPPITLQSGLGATIPTAWSVTPATYLIAPGVIGQQLLLSWSGNTVQYQLQYQINSGPWVTYSIHTPNYDILGVTAGDVYDFRLFGLSADGTLSPALDNTYTVPTIGSPPGAPTSLTAVGSFLSVILNWAAPPNLDLSYFQIFESAEDNVATASMVANNVGSTTFTVGGLPGDTTFYYWVRAVNTSGVIGPYNSNTGTSGYSLKGQSAMFEYASITQALIGSEAVGTSQIQNASIVNAQIQNAAVSTLTIAGNAVTTMAQWNNLTPNSSSAVSVNYVASGGNLIILVNMELVTEGGDGADAALGTGYLYVNGTLMEQGTGWNSLSFFCTALGLNGLVTIEVTGGSADVNITVLEAKR